MIKRLVAHEDEWAKRALMALGEALLKNGSLHGKLSLESTIDALQLYDGVRAFGWTPDLAEDAKKTLPKYAGYLWDLAVANKIQANIRRLKK